jgi:predicted RNA binding protein YcfA (HicA-like mRNA interferase family)
MRSAGARNINLPKVCDILESQGFARVRQRGSHVVMRRGNTSLPVPLHRELDRGTLRGIIRQAGVSKSLFEPS